MSFDLAQEEISQRLNSMPGTTSIEPGAWDGFVRGTGMATMKGFAKAGRAIDLLGSVGPIAQDAFTGGTVAQDRYFKEHDELFQNAVDYWTAKPGEVGIAGEVVGGLLSMLPQIFASPSFAVATQYLATSEDVLQKGVTPGKASAAGAAQAIGLGLGIWVPILGRTLFERVVVGGAGFNVVQGVATRGATGKVLEGTPAAEDFKAFDPTQLTLDVLLGLAFGSWAHLSPAQRAQGAETWGKIADWTKSFKPSDIDAIATLRQAQHKNADSLPGIPAGIEDVDAHVQRVNRAIDQLARDEPVDVQDIRVPVEITDRRQADTGGTQRTGAADRRQDLATRIDRSLELMQQAEATSKALAADISKAQDAGADTAELTAQWKDARESIGKHMLDIKTTRAQLEMHRATTGQDQPEIDPTFLPDPVKVDEANAQLRILQEEAARIQTEEGLQFEQPLRGKVYDTITEQLQATGRYAEKDIHPNAALVESFYTAMARRTGMTPEDMLAKYPLKITTEGPTGDALDQAKGEPFYSELTRQVDALKMGQAPAKGWKDTIKGLVTKGVVKQTEIDAVGLNDWLDLQQGKVTKQQMADFLAQNGVKVEETMLGEPKMNMASKYMIPEVRKLAQQSHGNADEAFLLTLENDGDIYRKLTAKFPELANDEDWGRTVMMDVFGQTNPDTPKFGNYQLPGGENYRELLLTLPPNTKADALAAELKDVQRRLDEIRNQPAEKVGTEERRLWGEQQRLATELNKETKGEFRSPHFDQPNILAHIRFNERTDAEGKRVLFIEELQSDWAQKGKKQGFSNKPGTAPAGWAETNDARSTGAGIPSAPFVTKTEAWVALSLKRMIRYAAENGFDKVAWTNGEQQAARYDLSKQVDAVRVAKMEDGKYKIAATKNGETIISHISTANDLPDVVGKDLANKIVSGGGNPVHDSFNNTDTYTGLDLKVGGEGMKAFYDKIVPNVANDVLKKLGGGRVGEVDIGVPLRLGEVRVTGAKAMGHTSLQPGFTITPAMRETAMQGQPLFQKGIEGPRGYFQAGENGPRIGLLAAADKSTFLHESGHFFLDVTADLAMAKDAPAELKADWARVTDWFHVEPGAWEKMTLDERRPYHEQFARGFEKFLAEGNAPTPELRGVFERFKAWLIDVYKTLQNLNVKLSPDVRGVMARMLGGDLISPDLPKAEGETTSRLLADIKELGGIKQDEMLDVTGERRFGKGVKGIPWGVFKPDGRGLDDLATTLRDRGWPIPADDVDGGVQALREIIRSELEGGKTQRLGEEGKSTGQMREMGAQEIFDRYAEMETKLAEKHGFDDTDPTYKADLKRIQTQRDYEMADALSAEGLRPEAEARRMVAENGDQVLEVGRNADGTPIHKTARQYLDDADAEARLIEQDEPLLAIAADCMIGVD